MFNSIRVRLTLWYLLVFVPLLIAFSTYIYSQLSRDLREQFDASLLQTAQATANYFAEFAERKNEAGGARETVAEFRLGNGSTAIFRDDDLLAASGPEITKAISFTNILPIVRSTRQASFATDRLENARMVAVMFRENATNYLVVVLEPLQELTAQLKRMRQIILFGLPAAVALAAMGGFLLAKKSLRPVVTISDQAEHISARNLDERLKIANPKDELGRLAGVINALLARLDASFRIMREFMADASHELRTPLAIIHGEAEVSLTQERSGTEYVQSLAIIRDQSKRVSRIVSDMLALAQADAGQQRLHFDELYLNDLVEECCRAAQVLASPKGVHLDFQGGEDIPFRGDEELLKRMALNLLDNAIHYTPPGGFVFIKLRSEPSWVRLSVSDTGIGIPPDCKERVFDRFYRVDSSRARADGGSGLGLSIVRLAAEAHKGFVDLSSHPGHGSTFTVSLPL